MEGVSVVDDIECVGVGGERGSALAFAVDSVEPMVRSVGTPSYRQYCPGRFD